MSKQEKKENKAQETTVLDEEENEVKAEEEASLEATPPREKPSVTEETLTEEPSSTQEETPTEVKEEADVAEKEADTEGIKDSTPSIEDELDLARQQAAEFEDNWKRAVAELANYKRRQEEQRKLQRDRIKGEVLERVVSALDDMDLAFQNLPDELDGQLVGWVEGFRLVQRKLDKILDDQNVMAINTDDKFDPNFHEAVSYEDSDDHSDGDIIAELRKGYQIGNRVIRPALVRVAK